jgi:putative addiction module CopG family antidote
MGTNDLPPITLSPDQRRIIDEQLRSGRFNSPGEVVAEALRRLESSEKQRQEYRDDIRRKIDEGLAQADRGELFDGDAFFDEWDREIEQSRHHQQRRPA